jgi:hypothetical protein
LIPQGFGQGNPAPAGAMIPVKIAKFSRTWSYSSLAGLPCPGSMFR